jgi:hypothetical protein
MNKILELREKRAKAWDAAKAFLDAKRGGDGLLSAEDTATYEKMENEVVALGKEIERLERQAVIDLELSKATSNPITKYRRRNEKRLVVHPQSTKKLSGVLCVLVQEKDLIQP